MRAAAGKRRPPAKAHTHSREQVVGKYKRAERAGEGGGEEWGEGLETRLNQSPL